MIENLGMRFQFCVEQEHNVLVNQIQQRIHAMCISVAFEHRINNLDNEKIYFTRLSEIFLETMKIEEFKQFFRLQNKLAEMQALKEIQEEDDDYDYDCEYNQQLFGKSG